MNNISARVDATMKTLGKRIEVMRKTNDLSLLQSEVLELERELHELEMVDGQIHEEEGRENRPYRRLPDIPLGRRDHVSIREPPELHAYDKSSIGVTNEQTRGNAEQPAYDFKFELKTYTPTASAPKPQDSTSVVTPKTSEKSGVKIKPATYDGIGH